MSRYAVQLGGPMVYSWGVGSPDATLIPADKWSVSATGLINIPTAEVRRPRPRWLRRWLWVCSIQYTIA